MMALNSLMSQANIDALTQKYDYDHAYTGDIAPAGRLSLSLQPNLSTNYIDTSGGGVFAREGAGVGTCKTIYPPHVQNKN